MRKARNTVKTNPNNPNIPDRITKLCVMALLETPVTARSAPEVLHFG
jgi:hypothetical protein